MRAWLMIIVFTLFPTWAWCDDYAALTRPGKEPRPTTLDAVTLQVAGETVRVANVHVPQHGLCRAADMMADYAIMWLRLTSSWLDIKRVAVDDEGRTLALLRDRDGNDFGERLISYGFAVPRVAGVPAPDWCGPTP